VGGRQGYNPGQMDGSSRLRHRESWRLNHVTMDGQDPYRDGPGFSL
jgi:hypothetical protein